MPEIKCEEKCPKKRLENVKIKIVGVQSRTECRPWNVRAHYGPKGAFLTLLRPVTEPP
jgi:hypothetical protein